MERVLAASYFIVDRDERPKARDGQRLGRLAIIIALALHLMVPVAIVAPLFLHPRAAPPPGIPVTLILEPPPEPPPQAKAKPADAPPPAPPAPQFRRSGPDTETAGPKQAETSPDVPPEDTPAAAPPPPSELAKAEPPTPAPPAAPVEPAPSAPADAAPEASSPAPSEAAAIPIPVPKPPPPSQSREATHPAARVAEVRHPPGPARLLAPEQKNGDPYINGLLAQMQPHHVYPSLARYVGLRGVVRLDMFLDRGGRLLGIELRQSSGSDLLDRAAAQMIRDSAPYPAPPPDMPGEQVVITIVAPYGPEQP
jgi:protein TonB